jgi:hypothetical protein
MPHPSPPLAGIRAVDLPTCQALKRRPVSYCAHFDGPQVHVLKRSPGLFLCIWLTIKPTNQPDSMTLRTRAHAVFCATVVFRRLFPPP